MSKKVILYIRVSTDEQAEKGFSLPAQEEKLRRYCESKNWIVVKVFREDHSAWKGFERPEYIKLKEFIKESKGKVDFLLFTQWSRFSREMTESLTELKALKKGGIEANAIEQWVDITVPESRYMLAFYLAAPQVENDRLSLRTKAGMRQALKQGRWMGKPPCGYQNDKLAKVIVPDPVASDIVTYAFRTFATGAYAMDEVRKMCMERGLKVHKQQFIDMLKNPFYAGKIFIKGNEEEEAMFVTGIHEPLIDWETFQQVQACMLRRRKSYKSQTKIETFTLKGHLLCPQCGKLVTGSTSKGNGGLYSYYHCQRKYGCKHAVKADIVHQAFSGYLSSFKIDEDVLALYYTILQDVFKTNDVERDAEKRRLENDLSNIKTKIKDLDERLMNESLPIERYNRLVKTMEEQEQELIVKLATLSQAKTEFGMYLEYGVSFLADVSKYYEEASFETKKRIIGSIFPERLVFDGKQYRTNKINEVFALISSAGAGLKRKMPGKNTRQSSWAPPSGLEPETL